MKLQGIFSSIATPFDHLGNLYQAKVEHNVAKWNRTTLSGYVAGGWAGEGAMLSGAEKVRLWEWVAQWAAAEKILICASGAPSVHETVELTNRAAGIGYKAALIAQPLPANGTPLYYRAVADQSKLPVIIGGDVAAETVALLSEHPNIVAVKEGCGDPEKLARLLRDAKKGFSVLGGSAASLWPALQAGATGAIVGFASAAPYACITIWEAHRMRESEACEDWQKRISEAARLVTGKYGVAGLKHAMEINGYYGGPPRLPLTAPDAEAKREIETAFAEIKG